MLARWSRRFTTAPSLAVLLSGTRTSSTPFGTPTWRPTDSRIFGEATEVCFAAITRINRSVYMLKQSIGPLALELPDLGRPRQCGRFGRRLDDLRLFGLGRQHRSYRLDHLL